MATLHRWERFVMVENISPLITKNDLELYFKKLGLERICFIHNPRNGSFMRKALILVDSGSSAKLILDEKYHQVCKDQMGETGMAETITVVKCTGSVKIYTHGLYKLFVQVDLPWSQDLRGDLPWSQDSPNPITSMGIHLTHELVRAFHGLIVTTMILVKDRTYTGHAILRFEHKSDKDEVLGRAKYILKAKYFFWTDSEDMDCWDKQPGAGVSEKVECDKVGDASDVQSCRGCRVMRRKKKKLWVPAMWRDKENENIWGTEVAEGPSEKVEGENILDVELLEEGGNPSEGEDEVVYQKVEGEEEVVYLGDEADEEGSFDSDGD